MQTKDIGCTDGKIVTNNIVGLRCTTNRCYFNGTTVNNSLTGVRVNTFQYQFAGSGFYQSAVTAQYAGKSYSAGTVVYTKFRGFINYGAPIGSYTATCIRPFTTFPNPVKAIAKRCADGTYRTTICQRIEFNGDCS